MLDLVYPMLPGAAAKGGEVTWDNAERLLLLADKWDLAAVKAAVERFVNANWSSRPTSGNGYADQFRWLGLASVTGLVPLFDMLAQEMCSNMRNYGRGYAHSMGAQEKDAAIASLSSVRHGDLVRLLSKMTFA